ncbi:MAG: Ig-like domain-containing protein [Bacteroidales bacterium]|jgi:uncharacterized protein YjdB|nr:Ig-like domain-containing protein [Bacteroidales bacterium]
MKRACFFSILLLLTATVIANIPVTSINVDGAAGASTITTDGGSLQMIKMVIPANATDKTVTWSVINGTGTATITSSGMLTAVSNGTVTVRATANDGSGIFGEKVITISGQLIEVTAITVVGAGGVTTITTDDGNLQMTAIVLPANANDKTVTWSVIDGTGTATINPAGLLTAVSNGTVTVRATANDGSGVFGELVITLSNQVVSVLSVVVNGAGGVTTITTDDGTLQMQETVLPVYATDKTVTWSIVSGSAYGSINASGLLTALDNGTVTVRAIANDGSGVFGEKDITISNQVIPVTGITVNGAGGITTITTDNGTLQMEETVLPANATDKTVTWSIVSGSAYGSVNASGLLTALDNGTVTVRATANDGSGVFGEKDITISNQVVPVTGITVNGTGGVTTITIDDGTLQMEKIVLPANATDKTVTWSIVSGSAFGSINASGLLTALDNGVVTVRATANDGSGIYGEKDITMSNQLISVTNITVTGTGGATTITTNEGTLQMLTDVQPANATNKNVSWSVIIGSGFAIVDASGLLTAKLNGTVTVKATAMDGSGVIGFTEITISGQIIPVSSVTVTAAGNENTITTDDGTLQMSVDVLPSGATDKTVTWSIVSGSTYGTVNASGLLTALDNGIVTVRATANDGSGVYGEKDITISNQMVPVTGITVNGAGGVSVITSSGGTLQMEATVLPVNATDKAVTWSVTNVTGSATINASGLLTATADGTVTVKATANDGSGIFGEKEITIGAQTALVSSITVSGAGGATSIIVNGGSLQMEVVVMPANAADKSVTWSITAGTGGASISSTGLLTAGLNGIVVVRATANDGSGVYGEVTILIDCPPLSVDAFERSILMYPNPALGVVYINSEIELKQFKILTTDGKVLLFDIIDGTTKQIDISNLNRGVYVVIITTESGINIKRKLIKN